MARYSTAVYHRTMAKPPERPREVGELLTEELRRRGMSEAEIAQATKKRKRRQVLEMNAVHSRWQRQIDPASRPKLKAEFRPNLLGNLLTVEFAARELNLHPKTILRFIHEGRLKANRVGKSYRILREDLEAFAGAPTGTLASENPARATSIVDIPGIDPDLAAKWAITVPAALRGRPAGAAPLRADVIYDPEARALKIVIVGSPADNADLLNLIRVWMDQLKA